ncbi:MAG: leucine--tRNA ligase, partial [Gammaproteobacteria bacterium SG8_47]
AGVEGAFRFLKRLWKIVHGHVSAGVVAPVDVRQLDDPQRDLRRQVHETIAKVSDDVARRMTFNTAIAAVMELINALYKFEDSSPNGRALMQEGLEAVVLLLAPIVPHIAHALWQALGHQEAVIDAAWPRVDEQALVRDAIEIVVQVNGKLRGSVAVAPEAADDEVRAAALAVSNVQRFIEGKAVRKVIVVSGRLVNIVVA